MDKYNVTLMGIGDGSFYVIHGLAIACMVTSLICVIFVTIFSFRGNPGSFYTWNKNDKFIVYLVLSDGIFNVVHFCDHLQILITRDHVRPIGLCMFYAAFIIESVYIQSFLVLFIAANAFLLVKYQKTLELGQYDWKLFVGLPSVSLIPVILALSLDSLGPVGAL